MAQKESLPVQVSSVHMIKPNLDVYYPRVEGLSNVGAQGKINGTILDTVNKLIIKQGYYENPKTEVTGTYELKANERQVLSLSIINYAFSGGAHGMTYVKSITTSTESGEIYELKELFKPGIDYVKKLSEMVKVQINERNIDLLDEFKGIRPDQDYFVVDSVLVLYFQLYEIAAYVYGFVEFPIPIYEIQEIIDENGPLGKMAASF